MSSYRPSVQKFRKHQQSKLHRRETAPPIAMFRATWVDVRHKRCREVDTPDGAASGSKRRRVIFCLAERVRLHDRRFLQDAMCMTGSQDARKLRLLTRFTAVTADLRTRSGILGLVRDYDSGHRGLMQATKDTFTSFCTPLRSAPQCQVDAVTDVSLLSHLRAITKVWDTDAAGDELLTGQELRTLF